MVTATSFGLPGRPGNGDQHAADRTIPALPAGPHVGEVTWFCDHRGFGYLRTDAGQDVFMSFRDLPGRGFRRLAAGERVTFTLDRDTHGAVARNVALLPHSTTHAAA